MSWSAGWAGTCEVGRPTGSPNFATKTMSLPARHLRLIHVSDIHFWQYALNPLQLFSKRLLGMASLLVRQARRFRLERVHSVVDRVMALTARPHPDHRRPDHHRAAGRVPRRPKGSGPLAGRSGQGDDHSGEPRSLYRGAHRDRRFEEFFGEFAPAPDYPWLRFLDSETAILGLDPTRTAITARGRLPELQLDRENAARPPRSADPPPDHRLSLSDFRSFRICSGARRQEPDRRRTVCPLAGYARSPSLLLRARSRGVGLLSGTSSQPALLERRRSAAPRPHRPSSSRLPRNGDRRPGRYRAPPRLERRSLGDHPALPVAGLVHDGGTNRVMISAARCVL